MLTTNAYLIKFWRSFVKDVVSTSRDTTVLTMNNNQTPTTGITPNTITVLEVNRQGDKFKMSHVLQYNCIIIHVFFKGSGRVDIACSHSRRLLQLSSRRSFNLSAEIQWFDLRSNKMSPAACFHGQRPPVRAGLVTPVSYNVTGW